MAIRERVETNRSRRRRVSTEMRVREYLDSLPASDRDAIEPIAREMMMNENMAFMLHHELMPLMHRLDRPPDELRADPHLDMLLTELSMRLPHFRKERLLSSERGVKNLVKLFEIIRESRYL